jgi:hypothetical protein
MKNKEAPPLKCVFPMCANARQTNINGAFEYDEMHMLKRFCKDKHVRQGANCIDPLGEARQEAERKILSKFR